MALRGPLGGGNDGLGSASSTATLTLPAGCQPGDIALFITVSNLGNTGTVTGTSPACTTLSGPNIVSGNNNSYVMLRTLTAGDISGGSITVTWNASGRVLAAGDVWSGLDASGIVVSPASSTTSSPTNLPTITTTADNSQVIALASSRVSGGSFAAATYPTGYTLDSSSGSKFGSGVQFGCSVAHRTVTGPAGSYGGGSISWSGTFSNAMMYVVGLAPAAAASTTYQATGANTATTSTAGRVTALMLAAATVAGISGTSGNPARAPRVLTAAGTVTATSGVSGAATRVLRTFPASGATAATVTTAGSPTSILSASGVVAATSGSTGAPSRILRTFDAAGTTDATSATTGSPSLLNGPATLPASGAVTATTATSGTLTARLATAGTVTASSDTGGSPTAITQPVTWATSGTIAAVSATTGAPQVTGDARDITVLFVVERPRPLTIDDLERALSITEATRTVEATLATRTLTVTGATRTVTITDRS